MRRDMLSERSRTSLDAAFACAARESFALDRADPVRVESIGPGRPGLETGDHLMVMTIASYTFRLLMMLHYSADPATVRYFSKRPDLADPAVALGELCNLCCGQINRRLGAHFSHMGMSTPGLLEGRCFAFVEAINPTYRSQHRIVIKEEVVLGATLCLCAYAPLDFELTESADRAAVGELELF